MDIKAKGFALLAAGLVALVFATGQRTAAVAAGTGPPPPAGHAGRWIVDPAGQVILVHGVNVSSKALPAYPAALDFDSADAAFLASEGFNAVRLTVERYAVEPAPGRFDASYVDHVAATVKMLASYGIYSLIGFHQDEFGPVFHDNGYPAWMTMTDGLPNVDLAGFPYQYLTNPALERAFDHLWDNSIGPDGRPLQSDDAAIVSYVAERLRLLPGILGYEIINEPWPGSIYPTCLVPLVGCPLFDEGPFSAYYDRMVKAIRSADPDHLIFYEPLVLFNYGIPTHVVAPRDPLLGFAFHEYGLCSGTGAYSGVAAPLCDTEDSLVISNAVSYAASTGDALLNTEFGGTTDTSQLAQQVAGFDQAMIPWMFWSYAEMDSTSTRPGVPSGDSGIFNPPTPQNINQAVLSTLARPYPQLVSGTPLGWTFDASTKSFDFSYTTERADGRGSFAPGSLTEVFLPPVQYAHGYVVAVRGAEVVSRPGSSLLRLAAERGAGTVYVSVMARSK